MSTPRGVGGRKARYIHNNPAAAAALLEADDEFRMYDAPEEALGCIRKFAYADIIQQVGTEREGSDTHAIYTVPAGIEAYIDDWYGEGSNRETLPRCQHTRVHNLRGFPGFKCPKCNKFYKRAEVCAFLGIEREPEPARGQSRQEVPADD